MNLKNKTILITGGSAGIGLEAAKQFIEVGSKVIITGRNQDKLDTAKTQFYQRFKPHFQYGGGERRSASQGADSGAAGRKSAPFI